MTQQELDTLTTQLRLLFDGLDYRNIAKAVAAASGETAGDVFWEMKDLVHWAIPYAWAPEDILSDITDELASDGEKFAGTKGDVAARMTFITKATTDCDAVYEYKWDGIREMKSDLRASGLIVSLDNHNDAIMNQGNRSG